MYYEHVAQTPSAQIISQMQRSSYQAWVLSQSKSHTQKLRDYQLDQQVENQLTQQAKASLLAQEKLEQGDCCDIETYIEHYYKSVDCKEKID